MSRFVFRSFMAVILAIFSAGFVCTQTNDNTPLTNAAVLKLVRAEFKEKTIISIIDARLPAYDLSPDRMIELKKGGVSERIILAMLNRQQGLSAYDEAWEEDDPFFQNKRDKEKGKTTDQNQQEIFGSSGSGQSSNRNRGGGGSNQSGDTLTTGTATVRIIRPPSEANAPLKLEKKVSLTNNSIIELVEAGFSEGTIVRRIEQSPVDFDLSPAKIAELRKHRVGDRLIAAMRMAMGDDSSTGKPAAPANGMSKPQ